MIKSRAVKKVQIALDKILDIKDAGYGCDQTERILERLNDLVYAIENGEIKAQ